jgi:hypothetical protein
MTRLEEKLGVPEGVPKDQEDSGPQLEISRVTVLLKPLVGETETVALLDPPFAAEPEDGLTLMEKSCCTKYAVTDLFEFIVIVTGFDEPEASPPQWSNFHPLAGVAVRDTFVPET